MDIFLNRPTTVQVKCVYIRTACAQVNACCIYTRTRAFNSVVERFDSDRRMRGPWVSAQTRLAFTLHEDTHGNAAQIDMDNFRVCKMVRHIPCGFWSAVSSSLT